MHLLIYPQYMDLAGKQKSYTESSTSYVVALVHAVWYHASIGQLSQIPVFIKDRLKPVIRTEEQANNHVLFVIMVLP